MSKSYKLKDGNYIDSTGIVHNKKLLSDILSIQEGQLTVNSNYFSSIDVNKVQKQGNIVTIDFRGLVSNDIPSNTQGILVSPYANRVSAGGSTGFCFIGDRYASSAVSLWFFMFGVNIVFLPITKGKYVHLHYTYLTNN